MERRTLILSIDLTGGPDWQVKAMSQQIAAWLNKNKTLLPIEDLIILPTEGETKLFWLEGDIENKEDIKTLEEIKDRLKPIMEVALDIKIDKERKFMLPPSIRPRSQGPLAR